MQQKPAFILALLITLLIAANVFLLSYFSHTSPELVQITRIIDGDTLVINNQTTIRLNNINTPEKGERGYQQAKDFLAQYENQTIKIETLGLDKYKRTLANLYLKDSTYLNLEIVKQGLAKKFLVEENKIKIFNEAEAQAIENELGLWKKSPHFSCFQSNIFPAKELIYLTNTCEPLNLQDWQIQEEGRKHYIFQNLTIGEINIHTPNGKNNETDLFLEIEGEIWNNDRDTFYLFDSEGQIVHYDSYGYSSFAFFNSP